MHMQVSTNLYTCMNNNHKKFDIYFASNLNGHFKAIYVQITEIKTFC